MRNDLVAIPGCDHARRSQAWLTAVRSGEPSQRLPILSSFCRSRGLPRLRVFLEPLQHDSGQHGIHAIGLQPRPPLPTLRRPQPLPLERQLRPRGQPCIIAIVRASKRRPPPPRGSFGALLHGMRR